MSMSENAILELPRRSVYYVRDGDREIGETKSRRVLRRNWPGDLYQRYVAYERPLNGERFRVIKTEERLLFQKRN